MSVVRKDIQVDKSSQPKAEPSKSVVFVCSTHRNGVAGKALAQAARQKSEALHGGHDHTNVTVAGDNLWSVVSGNQAKMRQQKMRQR